MKKIIALLLAALMVLSLVACGAKTTETAAQPEAAADAAASDLAAIKEKGKLIVGITDFAPMDYKNENGEWIGFDADMAKAFAETLGVAVEFVEIDWDNKALELDSKTIDCVWNGMTLTDEVKAAMDCSNAYCNNAQVVIVPAAAAENYQTAEACKDLRFAVEAGSAGEKEVTALGYAMTAVKSQADALLEVSAGTSDAAVIDSLMAAAMVGEGTAYEALTYTAKLNSEEYGVGFRKGSDLVAELNNFFAAAYADGYTSFTVSVSHVGGQHLNKALEVYSNGAKITGHVNNGNESKAYTNSIALTEALTAYNLDIYVYCNDNYGTGWNPASPADRFVLAITFSK